MPNIIAPTAKQRHYAYDIAESLGIALPAEENIETYADFIAAHKTQYNAKRVIDRNKRVELIRKDMPEESRRKEGTYVINQVEPRLRLQTVKRLKSDKPLESLEDLLEFMQKQMKSLDREHIAVINLDVKNSPINTSIVAIGTLTGASTTGREVFKSAILSNAASIILYHTHPSGNVSPSKSDVTFTREMIKCGTLLNIPVLDHVIIGPYSYYSFKKSHNLFKSAKDASVAE